MRSIVAVVVLAVLSTSCVPGVSLEDLIAGLGGTGTNNVVAPGINADEPSGLVIPEIGAPVSVQIISQSSVVAEVLVRFLVANVETHRSTLTVPPLGTPGVIGPDLAAVVEISGRYRFGPPLPSAFFVLGTHFSSGDTIAYIIPEPSDECLDDPDKLLPLACGCGRPETDTDGDGTPDCIDECPQSPGKTVPGVCGCDAPDSDTDGDGTLDCLDGCPGDANKLAAGVCGCGQPDLDGDGDGVLDCNDGCAADPAKTAPGVCGCGVADADADHDGALDCLDECPSNPLKTQAGVCGCDRPDIDTDGDGALDCIDGCPLNRNKTQPGLCGCDDLDIDSDQDGVADCLDPCPYNREKVEPGVCGCDKPDVDSDQDGVLDCNDGCPYNGAKLEPGACGCERPDTDRDEDGVADCKDGCPDDYLKAAPGACGCGVPDVDANENGVADCLEPGDRDTDGDGILDDGDGSGIAGDNPCRGGKTCHCDDNCPRVYNPDQEDGDYGGGDGIGRACEVYADFDFDGDVDADDFGHLQMCLYAHEGVVRPGSDAGWGYLPYDCFNANLDQDDQCLVNEADLALFYECFSGADVPVSTLNNPKCFGEDPVTVCGYDERSAVE